MVATTDVGFPIRLEGLVASDQASFCNYEPELFPGLIYKLQNPKICFLIFVSGKVSKPQKITWYQVCMGAMTVCIIPVWLLETWS